MDITRRLINFAHVEVKKRNVYWISVDKVKPIINCDGIYTTPPLK